MARLLAIIFFLAAVVVHGGLASIHSHWFDWVGLMLAGLLCLAFDGGSWPTLLWRRKGPQ